MAARSPAAGDVEAFADPHDFHCLNAHQRLCQPTVQPAVLRYEDFRIRPHNCFACGELNEIGLHLKLNLETNHATYVPTVANVKARLRMTTLYAFANKLGYRVIGTGQKGMMWPLAGLAKNFPAIMHLRLYGMNANGKVYTMDSALGLNQ